VTSKLREAEVDEAMKLPEAVAEVSDQTVAMADQFAQLVGGIRQPGHGGTLLGTEAGNTQRVDGIGLGALQILTGKAPGAQRIEQRDRIAVRGQRGEQVAPVMPRRSRQPFCIACGWMEPTCAEARRSAPPKADRRAAPQTCRSPRSRGRDGDPAKR
jgi:hypothetical protein